MKLFRQKANGNWYELMERVSNELKKQIDEQYD